MLLTDGSTDTAESWARDTTQHPAPIADSSATVTSSTAGQPQPADLAGIKFIFLSHFLLSLLLLLCAAKVS